MDLDLAPTAATSAHEATPHSNNTATASKLARRAILMYVYHSFNAQHTQPVSRSCTGDVAEARCTHKQTGGCAHYG